MTRLLDNPAACREAGVRAGDRARLYRLGRQAATYEDLYAELLSAGRVRRLPVGAQPAEPTSARAVRPTALSIPRGAG